MITSSPPILRSFDVTLFLEIPTATHHAKKIVTIRPRGRKPFHKLADLPELEAARKLYGLHLTMTGRRPSTPLDGAVSLDVAFVFSHETEGVWFNKKPDCSNLIKTLEDCLVAGGWLANDQRVCKLLVQKSTGLKAFVRIIGREMGGGLIPAAGSKVVRSIGLQKQGRKNASLVTAGKAANSPASPSSTPSLFGRV